MSEDTAVTQPEAPAAQEPVAPAIKYLELDAVIPDDFDDEDLRGKPVAKAIDLLKQYKQEIGVSRKKSMEYNDLNAKFDALQRTVEYDRQQQQRQRQQETPEQMRARLSARPDAFIDERVDPVRQEIQEVRGELFNLRAERVREQARRIGNFDEAAWDENTPAIAAIMHARGLNPADPQEWLKAAAPFKAVLAQKAKVEIPTPAAPPAGQARSSVKPTAAGARFRNKRAEESAKDAAAMMGYKPGTKRYDDLMEELSKETENE